MFCLDVSISDDEIPTEPQKLWNYLQSVRKWKDLLMFSDQINTVGSVNIVNKFQQSDIKP